MMQRRKKRIPTANNGSRFTSPPSEYKKLGEFAVPRWIFFIVPVVGLILAALILKRFGLSKEFFFSTISLLLLIFISIFLHERLHAWFFILLSDQPAIITWKSIIPNCRPSAPCTPGVYVAAALAPFILVAGIGIITVITYLVGTFEWVVVTLSFWTLSSFVGMTADIYYAFLLRGLPPDSLIVDCSNHVEMFIPSNNRSDD